MSFVDALDIAITLSTPARVEGVMPITDMIMQPFGVVHGGATISFLETLASIGALNSTDLEIEVPLGTGVNVRHRKPGRQGMLHGEAIFESTEVSVRTGDTKQIWSVFAYDDEGDVVSEGQVFCRIVSRARLEER